MIWGKTARKHAGNWHGGDNSALYQFASSGEYLIQYHLWYLKEIERAMHPEYDLYPGELSKKSERELNALKEYILNEGVHKGLLTEWRKHELYGYMIPFLANSVSKELADLVEVPTYLA